MKISAQEFRNNPRKAITLIGMSGAGKTHISSQLENWGWNNYSCDYEIGYKYLNDVLVSMDGFSGNNIRALSDYLGKLGNPDKGGFLLDKFRARQCAYYNAEVATLKALEIPEKGNFIHDSTGSFCEIQDNFIINKIGSKTLLVYLETGKNEDQEVLQRAHNYPKPLYFPPKFLSEKLDQFLSEFKLGKIDDIDPNDFLHWVFPLLFNARKPKYKRLAELYGVVIPSVEFKFLKSSEDFIEIIARYLDK